MQSEYRWMYQRCLLVRYSVSRLPVAGLLSTLDPDGIELRIVAENIMQRDLIICDMSNHLTKKKYDICGCIDGNPRKIIWSEVTFSSSDPCIVSGVCETFHRLKHLLHVLETFRGDRETENKNIHDIAEMQGVLTDRGLLFFLLFFFIYDPSTGK